MRFYFWIAGGLLIGPALYGMHRGLCSLERRGYIYYRQRSRSGGSSVMFELDKLIRPSIEHVIEAQDSTTESQVHDGE